MEFRYAENAKYLIMAFIGIIMSSLGYLTYIFTPIDLIVDSMTTIKPGSFIYNLWTEPPIELLIEVYVFNITNPKEFLEGTEKLRVKEVGPYTYHETLKNTEAVFNENGTLTYKPVRGYIFRPEFSIGDPKTDYVTIPNIPALGIKATDSMFGLFLRVLKYRSILNVSVDDYLWGYEEGLLDIAKFAPNWIDFDKFGLLDRMSSRDAGNVVTINLNETKDQFGETTLPLSISTFNGSPGLHQWNYRDVAINKTSRYNSKCNTIEGSFEPGLFPKKLAENTTLSVYRRAFCRPVNFKYENTSTFNGYKVYNYRAASDFLASGDVNPDLKCYCKKNKCLPHGFSDLSSCYYDIPIVISQPHFYNADESIRAQVDGLNPDKEKHDTVATVNPDLGLPIDGHIRIQVNLNIERAPLEKNEKTTMIPLIWLELRANELSSYMKFLLFMMLKFAPVAQAILMWTLGILGLAMVGAAALIIFYFPPERRLEDPYGHRIGYSPILVLPLSSRLKDVRIS